MLCRTSFESSHKSTRKGGWGGIFQKPQGPPGVSTMTTTSFKKIGCFSKKIKKITVINNFEEKMLTEDDSFNSCGFDSYCT